MKFMSVTIYDMSNQTSFNPLHISVILSRIDTNQQRKYDEEVKRMRGYINIPTLSDFGSYEKVPFYINIKNWTFVYSDNSFVKNLGSVNKEVDLSDLSVDKQKSIVGQLIEQYKIDEKTAVSCYNIIKTINRENILLVYTKVLGKIKKLEFSTIQSIYEKYYTNEAYRVFTSDTDPIFRTNTGEMTDPIKTLDIYKKRFSYITNNKNLYSGSPVCITDTKSVDQISKGLRGYYRKNTGLSLIGTIELNCSNKIGSTSKLMPYMLITLSNDPDTIDHNAKQLLSYILDLNAGLLDTMKAANINKDQTIYIDALQFSLDDPNGMTIMNLIKSLDSKDTSYDIKLQYVRSIISSTKIKLFYNLDVPIKYATQKMIRKGLSYIPYMYNKEKIQLFDDKGNINKGTYKISLLKGYEEFSKFGIDGKSVTYIKMRYMLLNIDSF